jgi:Mg2+/Co2+ transporter CorB
MLRSRARIRGYPCGAASARRSSASCTPRPCCARYASGGDLAKLDIVALATPLWFVPDTTTLKDQLNAFLKRKAHFAIVVDEYGEVMGLVTLEDIIEEIVGDITDETDIAAALARPQPDGSLIVDGMVPIRDVNRLMDWDRSAT